MALDLQKYRTIFLEEAAEHLAEIGRSLLVLEKDPASVDAIDTIFRMAHSIKSMAASLGYDSIRQGMIAMAVGGALLLVFMALYYKLSGLLADFEGRWPRKRRRSGFRVRSARWPSVYSRWDRVWGQFWPRL